MPQETTVSIATSLTREIRFILSKMCSIWLVVSIMRSVIEDPTTKFVMKNTAMTVTILRKLTHCFHDFNFS